MTLAESTKLKNCRVGREVLLYTENDVKNGIKVGDSVNSEREFDCGDRVDDPRKPETSVLKGKAEYQINMFEQQACPYCTVTSCKNCRS